MNQCVQEFLKKALEPVKYKKMHPYLAQELNDHIEALKEEFMEDGMDEEIAYQKAVAEMGEPEQIGISLHQIHKPKVEWRVIVMMLVVIGMGLFTLSRIEGQSERYATSQCLIKQGVFIGGGIVSFLILYFIDYRKLEKISGLLYIVGAGFIIANCIIGQEINGIRSVLYMGPIMIRSTYVAVPLFIISYVAFVRKWANRGIIGYGILSGTGTLATILCVIVGAMEGVYMVVVLLSIFIMYMMSESFKGSRKKVTGGLLGGGILGIGLVIWYIGHSAQRVERIIAWINPKSDPLDTGYLANVVIEILGGATWFGQGEGIKIAHMDKYLPGLNGDFVFTFIIGMMGYVVAVGVILVISMMLIRCFKASNKVSHEYGRMLLKAISLFFTIQYVVSLLMNVALIPMTAVSIPFISYGGGRVTCDLALMGFFLGIYRRKDIVPCELLKEEIVRTEGESKKYNSMILGWALHILRSSNEIEEVNITFKEK